MTYIKNENKAINLAVTEGLNVTVIPNTDHEFLMSTNEVAKGYGASEYSIRMAKKRNSAELSEGKHFISGVTISHAASPGASKGTLWTKRGIVRLGFFIRSERARLFRDWAEDLIINMSEAKEKKQLPAPRQHNRLTPTRLVNILADVARVENSEIRNSLVNKLTGRE
jgi:hypothetical protein